MDANTPMMPQTQSAMEGMQPLSPLKEPPVDLKPSSPRPIPISPSRNPYPGGAIPAPSPSRLRSSSPRLNSPASSEIFERNVQEPVPASDLQNELLNDAHVPSHMLTEDHIPPALDASAEVITSEQLNPDEVEIVTATAHQPASAPILDASTSASQADLGSLPQSPLPAALRHQSSEGSETASMHASGLLPGGSGAPADDNASTYGSLDPNDARRVSFISFADVVHTEHAAHPQVSLSEIGSRDSLHIGSLPSNNDRTGRSPSHSLSGGVATPPEASAIPGALPPDVEQSPVRSVQSMGSPAQTGQHGELTTQTMRQAIRKTASGDMTGVKSAGMSPVSSPVDDGSVGGTRSRGNT